MLMLVLGWVKREESEYCVLMLVLGWVKREGVNTVC